MFGGGVAHKKGFGVEGGNDCLPSIIRIGRLVRVTVAVDLVATCRCACECGCPRRMRCTCIGSDPHSHA